MKFSERLKSAVLLDNPVFMQTIGLCPALATTTSLSNAIGMGAAATVVLICSNIVISLLRKFIPDKVRIAAFITIIAGFVTIIDLSLQAFVPSLAASLGLFLPLIVVNCIILGRAEMFASKNSVIDSILDGLGMGLGFTLALFMMGSIRELLGAGTIFGVSVLSTPISIFGVAPGGFFVFGLLVALVNKITKGKAIKKKEFSCAGCPAAGVCGQAQKGEC